MTQAQCDSLWQRADAAKSGSLTQSQASAYVSDFSGADTNKDGKISLDEFKAALANLPAEKVEGFFKKKDANGEPIVVELNAGRLIRLVAN